MVALHLALGGTPSDGLHASTGGFATDLAVRPDGRVYVTTFGDGLLSGSH
jgi:hypothetical protein